jgi:hypothetical protein
VKKIIYSALTMRTKHERTNTEHKNGVKKMRDILREAAALSVLAGLTLLVGAWSMVLGG